MKFPLGIQWGKKRGQAEEQLMNICAYLAPDNIQPWMLVSAAELLPSPLKEAVAQDGVWAALTRQKANGYAMAQPLQTLTRQALENDPQWAGYGLWLLKRLFTPDCGREGADTFLLLSGHVEAFIAAAAPMLPDDESRAEMARLYAVGGYGFHHLGQYDTALSWHQRALALREKVLEKDHPDIAISCNNIAGVFSHRGQMDDALRWFQRALDILEKSLGTEHPLTVATYINLAVTHYNQGNAKEALVWYQKALAVREGQLGAEHPDTAALYHSIGSAYNASNDDAEAMVWLQKALAVRERVLPAEHPDTADTCLNIALIYVRRGDNDQALTWLQRAHGILLTGLGPEHPKTQSVQSLIQKL